MKIYQQTSPDDKFILVSFTLAGQHGTFLYRALNLRACQNAGELLTYLYSRFATIRIAVVSAVTALEEIRNSARYDISELPVHGICITEPCAEMQTFWDHRKNLINITRSHHRSHHANPS